VLWFIADVDYCDEETDSVESPADMLPKKTNFYALRKVVVPPLSYSSTGNDRDNNVNGGVLVAFQAVHLPVGQAPEAVEYAQCVSWSDA